MHVMICGGIEDYVVKPIKLQVKKEDGFVCLENEELEIYGCGNTFTQALECVTLVIKVLMEEFAECRREELSDGALMLRRELLKLLY